VPRPSKAASQAARLLGRAGGKARVRAMSADELSAAATKAIRARWSKTTKADRSAAASKASRARWAKAPQIARGKKTAG
jgi:hypothetical protein